MKEVKNEIVKAERITEGSGHYFFGYYDVPAWSRNGRYHLSQCTNFWDRVPEENDMAQIGIVDIINRSFIRISETYAWNFQQGSMLRWNPKAPDDEVIFNVREGGEFQGVLINIHTGEKRGLSRAVACVDEQGKYALAVSFSRLFDFRRVCGYAGMIDPFRKENHPAEDGVFLVDLNTGKSKLILSLEQIWNATRDKGLSGDPKLAVNHIAFNQDGSRFMMLVRNFPEPGKKWSTAVVTANVDGTDLYCLSDYSYASHYYWKDPAHLLLYGRGPEGDQLYLMTDQTREVVTIDKAFFVRDGHCSYSPDNRWILYDSYPDEESYRHLYLYHVEKRRGVTLGSYYSYPQITGDIRCDLHPRWNRSGTAISFDSVHEGKRNIYFMQLEELMADFK